MNFKYYINLDERGEFFADVRNSNDETIFEIHDFEIFEDGFREIELTNSGENNFLFRGMPKNILVYESHGDILKRFPIGVEVLAMRGGSIEAYSVENFCGVQFHPEITWEIAKKMAERDENNIDEIMNNLGKSYDFPNKIISNFISSLNRN